jgi:hypothetical protein
MIDDELWTKVEQIHGWLWREEADTLDDLNSGEWCEVGCWQGRSTRVLAEKNPGWAVDWFQGSPEHEAGTDTYEEFMRNVGWHPNVTVVRSRFENAADHVGRVDLLHLDADHSYDATKLAFDLYSPKVRIGGHVVFHDARGGGWPSVERFVAELKRRPGWAHVVNVGRAAAFQRV